MKGFQIAGETVALGERKKIDISVAKLYDFTEMNIPVEVIRGKLDGPVLFVSAAIHGDEINGTEIIKRLLTHSSLKKLKGTLIAVPIVNVFGFNTKSRYLPDRRDLNRSFPGLKGGSLAAQLAYTFINEIIAKSTHGIDLHTGAIHRYNLPQIRASMSDEETNRLAHAFNVPVIVNSELLDGSLRAAARERNIPILLFEGGEALRFNEPVIKTGLKGVISVMREINMLPKLKKLPKRSGTDSFIARSSHWVRSPHSGTLVPRKKIGDHVKKNEILGVVSDPFGECRFEVYATYTGIIIGATLLPLVNEGDAVFHIATFEDSATVKESIDTYEDDSHARIDTFST
ncbi:MAG: putative deacylase [Alphaproteobacteria bacterium]|jgi:predicted deacylase